MTEGDLRALPVIRRQGREEIEAVIRPGAIAAWAACQVSVRYLRPLMVTDSNLHTLGEMLPSVCSAGC